MTTACPFETEIDDSVISNFDHEIVQSIAERLKVEEAFSRYPGWNFNGRVWWDRTTGTWKCEVWCYGVPREVVDAPDLQTIHREVCDRYGYE